jgi:hypothetical protein
MMRIGLFISVFGTALLLAWLPLRRPSAEVANPAVVEASSAPVLVELFTSEGCSSCPPADALLAKLDRSQPIGAGNVVVLSEHVDYWDDTGWRDPYSSHQVSIRQSDYADRFHTAGPYTPQMVVDGAEQFVGSDEGHAIKAIERETKAAKVAVKLASIHADASGFLAIRLEIAPSSAVPSKVTSGEIWIALADDSDESSVTRGENAGRSLRHVAVVRKLTKVGTVGHDGSFSGDVKIAIGSVKLQNLRIVAFVQESSVGRVLGVSSAQLSN